MSRVEEAKKDFLDLWETIDEQAVNDAILNQPLPIADYDFEDAKECVHAAAKRWLVRDKRHFEILGLEEKFEHDKAKCVIDVRGRVLSYDDFPGLKPYVGGQFILDWKTSRSALDTKWQARYTDSWQWKIYSSFVKPTPALFIYRGVKRPGKFNEPVELREVIIDVEKYANNAVTAAERTLVQIREQINDLIAKNVQPWPQNMPSSCFAYGRECPYYQDCTVHTEPAGNVDPRPLSYTRMKTFQECPERYRRGVIASEAGLDNEESDDTIFGSAVHRGLESVWKQAFQLGESN